jgi:hypothetical protein
MPASALRLFYNQPALSATCSFLSGASPDFGEALPGRGQRPPQHASDLQRFFDPFPEVPNNFYLT